MAERSLEYEIQLYNQEAADLETRLQAAGTVVVFDIARAQVPHRYYVGRPPDLSGFLIRSYLTINGRIASFSEYVSRELIADVQMDFVPWFLRRFAGNMTEFILHPPKGAKDG